MANIFLDVETIPDQRPEVRAHFANKVAPPGTLKKAESIAKWEAEDKPGAIEDKYRGLALNPWFARVICASIAVDDEIIVSVFYTDEARILLRVFDFLNEHRKYKQHYGGEIFVGHNILYDLRVLYARALINGLKPPHIPYNAKPWSDAIFDTANVLNDKPISMDDLCVAFGIEGKDGFCGKDVYDAWQRGELPRIAEYCNDDVERTRKLYKRLAK